METETKEEVVSPVRCIDCKFWWPNLCIAINEITLFNTRKCSRDGSDRDYRDGCDKWKDRGYTL